MADKTLGNTVATTEERQQRIDAQTSVGKYTMKQIYEITVTLAGAAAGFAAVKYGLLKNAKVRRFTENQVEKLALLMGHEFSTTGEKAKIGEYAGSIAGGLLGTMVSGITLAYGHWKGVESEKLAVGEINKDVGNLVVERARFADTLNRQESVIKELIAQRGAQADSAVNRLAAEPAATMERT